MATKFVGYVPDVKEFADANGKTIKINRVRLNMVDDNARGCIGQDVQYYMVKKEDLQRVCGVKEFEELRQYIGYKAFISMTLDVRFYSTLFLQLVLTCVPVLVYNMIVPKLVHNAAYD